MLQLRNQGMILAEDQSKMSKSRGKVVSADDLIEVYGTDGSAKFSTRDPKAFRYSETIGKEQPWSRIDVGMSTVFPVVTGGIFEFGFSDAIQQMFAAFLLELSGAERNGAFGCVTPEETAASHQILTAALTSFKEGRRVEL